MSLIQIYNCSGTGNISEKHCRVHWVAVNEEHQNKGIAKALITKILDIYHELGYKDYIYLTTQTWSYAAINIYLGFGFKPYLGEQLPWKSYNFVEENKNAWALIFEKIHECESLKNSAL